MPWHESQVDELFLSKLFFALLEDAFFLVCRRCFAFSEKKFAMKYGSWPISSSARAILAPLHARFRSFLNLADTLYRLDPAVE